MKRAKPFASEIPSTGTSIGVAGVSRSGGVMPSTELGDRSFVGNGKVFFYDSQRPVIADEPDFVALAKRSGDDLARRAVLVDTTEKESESKFEKSDSE